MREQKKPSAELPTVKMAAAPQPGQVVMAPHATNVLAPMDRSPLDVLEARFVESQDAGERRALLEEIRWRFGNDKAAQLASKLGRGRP
jgi:hypothetical protein